jgi:hypothetical protein
MHESTITEDPKASKSKINTFIWMIDSKTLKKISFFHSDDEKGIEVI